MGITTADRCQAVAHEQGKVSSAPDMPCRFRRSLQTYSRATIQSGNEHRALGADSNNGAPGQLSFKYLMPLTQQCPVRLPAQLARRNRSRANVVQAWLPSPVQTPSFSWVRTALPHPCFRAISRKTFWFRGLRQKPGQCFVVCGRNLSCRARHAFPLISADKGLEPRTSWASYSLP